MIRPFTFPVLLWGLILVSGMTTAQDEPANFSREILPILSDRCFHCHGPDEAVREADLRLDQRESALGMADSPQVIVPGNAAASELIARISTKDPGLLMPPPDSGRKPLTPVQIETVRRWISEGANWGQHWSFEKPARPRPSSSRKSAIDAFVEQRLKKAGLSLSPRASKRTLIRRLSLDLTGLPPTVEQVNQFLTDPSDDAYEKVVDRLLSSPHYGERMAWPWLDAARYADSSGYQGDPERTMWPWRDWVIHALNSNMPFDQFTVEQLAGDLLPDPTPEQRLATGFNRNHMHNSEGGRIAEETRVENVFDRAETTGTVWLGMTLQCARCHDHKYDPTSRKEYFEFFDFFNQTTEDGRTDRSVAVPPAMEYVPLGPRKQLDDIDAKIAKLKSTLVGDDTPVDQQQTAWEKTWLSNHLKGWKKLRISSAKSEKGATLSQRDDGAIHATGDRPEKDVYVLEMQSDLNQLRSIRLDALLDPDSPARGTGRDEKGNFVLSEIELSIKPRGKEQEPWRQTRFDAAFADFSQGNYTVDKAIDGKIESDNGWAVSGHTVKAPRWAIFQLAETQKSDSGFDLRIRLRFESQHTHHTLALFRLSAAEKGELGSGLVKLDLTILQILQTAVGKRTAEQTLRLKEYYRANFHPQYRSQASELNRLLSLRNQTAGQTKKVKVMVMDTRSKPRETVVLVKGIYNNPTEQRVTAGVPGMLPKLEPVHENQRLNRLDLARWIVSTENPLTARVTVNRFWQTIFGRGLVETPNDFGLQGKQPSHPELLDWLAVEFMESGWNVKDLHKLIVMSQTYQQTSRVTPKLLRVDPDNRLLSRSPRYRLPSWMIRDQALAASGLLQPKLGGAPVKPYQPAGVWSEATFGKKTYSVDSGENLYRRSIYTFWRRIIGPTMFFDASKRQTCEVQPSRTNTPLHALTVLNDTAYVEAARILAAAALKQGNTLPDQLEFTFARLCSRPPRQEEIELLEKSYAKIKRSFEKLPEQARELVAVGQLPHDETLDVVQLATLTTVVNMLMNLDEVLVRP